MTIKTARLVLCALALLACVPAQAQAQAPTCNQAQAPDCLYFPSARYGFATYERSMAYRDVANQLRQVKVLIRVPLSAPVPLPMVV